MGKIYYSVDVTSKGYPVYWIDLRGETHIDTLAPTGHAFPGPADVCEEFVLLHPGAVYLAWNDFLKRLSQVEIERAKLAAWKEWAV